MGEDSVETRRRLARANALMQGAGALLCLFAVLTPGAVPAGPATTMYFLVVATCAIFCVTALLRREQFGLVAVMGSLLAGDAAIGLVASVSHQRPGGSSTLLLLLWPTMLAAVFLNRRLIKVQLVATGLVGVGVFHPAKAGVGVAVIQVVVLIATLTIAAFVVLQLRERLTLAVDEQGRLSRTDPLTGLANRRGLEEQLAAVWGAAARRAETVVVLLLDVDHFKHINDAHGHAVGDQVLQELAGVVRPLLRKEDVVARFGGEELVVVAAERHHAATEIGERLRAGVQTAPLAVAVTVSIGVVAHQPEPGEDARATFTRLLRMADDAMYAAKRAGRNQVVTHRDQARLDPSQQALGHLSGEAISQ